QLALVESCSSFERLCCALGHQLLEGEDIDVRRRRIQSDPLSLCGQETWRETAYGLANGKQSLSEVAPRLLLAGATPEQCGQLIARVTLARPRGQVCEECLGLRRHNKRWATVQPRLEAAQERKSEPPHLSPSVAPTLVPVLGTNQGTAEVGSRAL